MKVLDATFLIDYLAGVPAAAEYYEANEGPEGFWMMPAPAHAEALVGVGNHPTGDVDRAIEALDAVYVGIALLSVTLLSVLASHWS